MPHPIRPRSHTETSFVLSCAAMSSRVSPLTLLTGAFNSVFAASIVLKVLEAFVLDNSERLHRHRKLFAKTLIGPIALVVCEAPRSSLLAAVLVWCTFTWQVKVLCTISLYLALKTFVDYCETNCASEHSARYATVLALEMKRAEHAFGTLSRHVAALLLDALSLARSLARGAKLVFQIPKDRYSGSCGMN